MQQPLGLKVTLYSVSSTFSSAADDAADEVEPFDAAELFDCEDDEEPLDELFDDEEPLDELFDDEELLDDELFFVDEVFADEEPLDDEEPAPADDEPEEGALVFAGAAVAACAFGVLDEFEFVCVCVCDGACVASVSLSEVSFICDAFEKSISSRRLKVYPSSSSCFIRESSISAVALFDDELCSFITRLFSCGLFCVKYFNRASALLCDDESPTVQFQSAK